MGGQCNDLPSYILDYTRAGGVSTAAAVTLDTVADESSSYMADGVTRFQARLCSRDGKIGYYERLGYDFLPFSVPCFLFLLFSPALSWHVHFRDTSSVQLQSPATSSTCFIVRVLLVSLVSCLISEPLRFCSFTSKYNFFVVLISRVAFLLSSRTRYART